MSLMKRSLPLLALVLLAACGGGPPAPGFTLTVWPASFNQPRGEQAALGVRIERLGDFAAGIELSLVDAPHGFTAHGAVAPGETEGELLVQVAADAALGPADLTVIARGADASRGIAERRAALTLIVLEATEPF